ncbi:MAG: cold shock domain-containing protein [Planctomycetota bacterium]
MNDRRPKKSESQPPKRSPLSSKTGPEPTESDESNPKFRIQRRRLGKIMTLRPDSQFGFIDGEDFREDVFFHRDVWRSRIIKNGRPINVEPEEGMWVEYELDDERFETEQKLRAKMVRPTNRPGGRKLSGRDATFKIVTHHPRARRKRPSWRDE